MSYTWTGNKGTEVLSGCYDVSQPSRTLKTGESCFIYAPINLPPVPGAYRLNVSFDSRDLLNLVNSSGSSNEADRIGCFKADANASIQIPDHAHLSKAH